MISLRPLRPLRPLALLALSPLLGSAAAWGQEVAYAPGTASYRVTTVTRGTQRSPMGNQPFAVTIDEQITVALARRAADTLAATLTIDSIALGGSGPAPDMRRYRGSAFVTLVSPTGAVYSMRGPEGGDPVLAQLGESVRNFLPTIRRDLRPGVAWSDSSSGKVTQQGMQVDRTIRSSYTVTGDTVVDGTRAWRLQRHTAVTAAGAGTANGTAVTLASSTAGEATLLISPDGRYLGATSRDDVDLKLTLSTQGIQIDIQQQATQSVHRLR